VGLTDSHKEAKVDLLRIIKSRRSTRKFSDKPVEQDKIALLLEAARWAPSAGNSQPWRFVVVGDKKKIKKFDPFLHQPWVANAPVVIVVLALPSETHKLYGPGSNWYIQDCAAAVENMLLMAHELGLGAVWIVSFSKEAIRKQLGLNEQYDIVSIVSVGYPQNANAAGGDQRLRKSLDKIAFLEDLVTPWTIKPESK